MAGSAPSTSPEARGIRLTPSSAPAVRVNTFAPGFMETEMVHALPTYETIKERAIQMQPIKRVGRPDDIADAVAFLASERAGFITGEVLHVTGGRYG